MNRILVTGGCGFIGSCFIRYLMDTYDDIHIVNLDALTYAGNPENLNGYSHDVRYDFVKGDIRDKSTVRQVFEEYALRYVVNFAAESHVDRSITDPNIFLSTNVLGTLNLLNCFMDSWDENDVDKRFLQVSTDEVYGSLERNAAPFTERSPLLPSSPYSASKASADLLARSYYKTYGTPILITRCSNNYGPFQFPEKLIPLMIRNAIEDKPLPVYGDGMQRREWIYVQDHCLAIDLVLRRGRIGEIYNIGGTNEYPNLDVVKMLLKRLNKSDDLIRYVKDRPGHDARYALDSAKIREELGWSPTCDFETGLDKTVEWYRNNGRMLLGDMRNCL